MKRKNWVWQLVLAAFFAVSAVCFVAACRADGSSQPEKKCDKSPDAACPQCTCTVIALYQDNGDGNPPALCGVCEISGESYCPCAPSVVECPSQNRKKLSACPLCHECRKMLMKKMCRKMHVKTDKNGNPDKECMKKIMNCPVKKMLDAEAIAKNRQCKKCKEIAKATAKLKKLQHQHVCSKDCKKEGLCVCKEDCSCTNCGTPDCKCACPCSEPVLIEEDIVEIGEIVPDNVTPGKKDAYPIPAPPQKPVPPPNVAPPQINETDSPAVIID